MTFVLKNRPHQAGAEQVSVGSARAAAFVLALALSFSLTTGLAADDAELRGAPLGDSPVVSIVDILENPEAFVERTVIIEGVAEQVCETRGCWMVVTPEAGQPGIRVTFLDYGFFVPTDGAGMAVRAEGSVSVSEVDAEHAEHLVEEGVELDVRDDGSAVELGFVATGVEIRR